VRKRRFFAGAFFVKLQTRVRSRFNIAEPTYAGGRKQIPEASLLDGLKSRAKGRDQEVVAEGQNKNSQLTHDHIPAGSIREQSLKRDCVRSKRNRALAFCLRMISARTHFCVCRDGKLVPTFPDHALVLLCHKFAACCCALAATRTAWQGSGDGVSQPDAHGRD
jgi:hypothetical protein